MDERGRFSIAPALPTRVVPVPASDLEFARYVRDSNSGDLNRAALEERLRARYPRARLRPNDLSGRDAVLYAFRDGRWESGHSN